MGMLPCQIIFGVRQGDDVIDLVKRATGKDCPCLQGAPCPLAPLLEPAEIPRAG